MQHDKHMVMTPEPEITSSSASKMVLRMASAAHSAALDAKKVNPMTTTTTMVIISMRSESLRMKRHTKSARFQVARTGLEWMKTFAFLLSRAMKLSQRVVRRVPDTRPWWSCKRRLSTKIRENGITTATATNWKDLDLHCV